MPRTKRGGRRGNFSTTLRDNKHGGLEASFTPLRGIPTPQQNHHGFTLQEEARNTGRQSTFWNSDQRLRDSKVNFISAGTLDTKDSKDSEPNNGEAAMAEMTLESPKTEMLAEGNWLGEAWEPTPSLSPPVFIEQQSDIFVIDTHGSQPIVTGLPPPRIRPASPTPSNSSEEIILFRGKNRQPTPISKQPKKEKPENPRIGAIDTRIKIIEEQIHDQMELLEEVQHHNTCPQGPVAESSQRQPQSNGPTGNTIYTQEDAWEESVKGKGKQRRYSNRRAREKDEALIADYIANLAQDEEDEDEEGENQFRDIFRLRELGWVEGEMYQEQAETTSGEPITNTVETSGWNTEDLRDFDGISTSDGEPGDVENILSKRMKSGPQYLVVYGGQSMSDAKWIKITSPTSSGALKKIAEFEAEEKLMINVMREAERVDDSTNSSDKDADDSLDDDEDLIRGKKERISDEQIARLLTKQEELGMGSIELLLIDAKGDEEEDEAEDDYIGFSQPKVRSKPMKQSQGPGAKRPRGAFPATSAFANAYDNFDPTDRDRPSLGLKKKPKGRKSKLPFDISDSELEASMQRVWDYDRVKKGKRKQEREELRAQGLLGSKNSKIDLKEKYKEGMGIEAVKEEIKKFLMGTNTTLPLTPMDKADRKIVHEFANAFNLKSKSVGNGSGRLPILYRKPRTSAYSEGKFAAIEARITRRFMPRMDVSNRNYGAVRPHKGGSGFGNSSASYRDGDVVGASAPELGVENRGRAMLEKMGWSTGTALGAFNNKGILEPVSHVVKTTKAGLG